MLRLFENIPKWRLHTQLLVWVCFACCCCLSCKSKLSRKTYSNVNALLYETSNLSKQPFLKVHLKNGELCVLENWQVDTLKTNITGTGKRYSVKRAEIFNGQLVLPIDSVSLFETNVYVNPPESPRIATLTFLTVANIALTTLCITNPKACFGSCPTFYVNPDDNYHFADAEGFSHAILPSLQCTDIDALQKHFVLNGQFELTMKNEALETHCIDRINLLCYPVKNGERVYQNKNGSFYLCDKSAPPVKATSGKKNILQLLAASDRIEWFSLADNRNLKAKEEIFLEFDETDRYANTGLLLEFRQTMLPTYLFYQAMGFMGNEAGDMFAAIESDKNLQYKLLHSLPDELGEIEIYLWQESKQQWLLQGSVHEFGPIAINREIIQLPDAQNSNHVKIKLVLNKGLWRIDHAALLNINKQITPQTIHLQSITHEGTEDTAALHSLKTNGRHLVTYPGNVYTMHFNLPQMNEQYELFLETEGYYLEWMRDYWLQDKNTLRLNTMVNHPGRYLRKEAKNFKKAELQLEEDFWNSKIQNKAFTHK